MDFKKYEGLNFEDKKLNDLVNEISSLNKQIASVERLEQQRNFVIDNLKNQTFTWSMKYELYVKYDFFDKEVDEWALSTIFKDIPYFREEIAETESKARDMIKNAKSEIEALVGQEISLCSMESATKVIDYNITLCNVIKGNINDNNIVYEEKNNSKSRMFGCAN